MKKIYFYAAALAVSAALSSCSENELAEVNQPVVDPADAFGVTVNMPGNVTKSGVTDITTATFDKFLLTGMKSGASVSDAGGESGVFFKDADDTKSMQGTLFSLSSGSGSTSKWTPNGTFTWTGNNENGTFNFFAVSNNTGVRPVGVMFTGEGTDKTSVPIPTFTYTLPGEASEQEDLLVASKLAHAKSDGLVALNFNHALAKINFTVSLDDAVLKGSRVFIEEIRLHGLNTKAKYTFSSTTNNTDYWTAVSEASVVVRDQITLNYKDITNNDIATYVSKSPREKEAYASVYVIPEAYGNMQNVWNYQDGDGITTHPECDTAGTAYIEVKCRFIYDQDAGKKRTLATVYGTTDADNATQFMDELTGSDEYNDFDEDNPSTVVVFREKVAELRTKYGFETFNIPITDDELTEPFRSILGLESFDVSQEDDVDDDGFYYKSSNPVEDHASDAWNNMMQANAICSTAGFWPVALNPSWSVMLPLGIGVVEYADAINTASRAAEYAPNNYDNGTEILYLPLKLKNFLNGADGVDNGIEINKVYNYNIKLDAGAVRQSKVRDGQEQYGYDAISGEVEVQ